MKRVMTPARLRLAIQFAFTVFNIYVGFRFAAFLAWAMGETQVFTPKPGAVEGFLPISALLGLRQLVETGQWDMVHPAGLTIFLAILVMAFLFRKGFCGYICPVGFLSNLLDKGGRRIGLARIPHKWIDSPLTAIKYLGAGFFLYIILTMDSASVQSFISGPYNMVADAKMLAFFTSPSAMSLLVIAGLGLFSLVFRNAWCRYLCPYGALLGLISWFSPTAVARQEQTCIGCGRCRTGCPAGIEVDRKSIVRTPECIGCAECIGNCPVDGCLSFAAPGGVRLSWLVVGLGSVAVLLAFYGWAKMTGHWDIDVPPQMLKRIYATFFGAA